MNSSYSTLFSIDLSSDLRIYLYRNAKISILMPFVLVFHVKTFDQFIVNWMWYKKKHTITCYASALKIQRKHITFFANEVYICKLNFLSLFLSHSIHIYWFCPLFLNELLYSRILINKRMICIYISKIIWNYFHKIS